MDSRTVIAKLKKDGWARVAQKGSHVQLKHPHKKGRVSVPHPLKDMPIGRLNRLKGSLGRNSGRTRGREMKRFYPAIIEKEGNTYGVYFPDFDGCVSVGNTVPEVMRNAEEVLVFHIRGMLEDGEEIPRPSGRPSPEDVKENEFLALIGVDLDAKLKRVNVMLNEFLLGQIDAVASNRSGFLSEAAQEKLTRLRDGTD